MLSNVSPPVSQFRYKFCKLGCYHAKALDTIRKCGSYQANPILKYKLDCALLAQKVSQEKSSVNHEVSEKLHA